MIIKFNKQTLATVTWVVTEFVLYVVFSAAVSIEVQWFMDAKKIPIGNMVGAMWTTLVSGSLISFMQLHQWKTDWPWSASAIGLTVGFLTLNASAVSLGILSKIYLGTEIFWLIPVAWVLFFAYIVRYGLSSITIKSDERNDDASIRLTLG